jgi:hypothetical protein
MSDNKTWTVQHQKRYLWLYNWLITDQDLITVPKTTNKDNYLTKLSTNILINAIHQNKTWGDSSKESLYFMVARWFEINDKNKDIDYIKKIGYNIKQKRDDEEGENELDEKEKINYRDHEYFINILNNITAIKTYQEHREYLLLMLLVKQPPVRTSFYTSAKFVINKLDIKEKNNYIYFADNNKIYMVINKDKVSLSKTYKNNEELSYIEITDDELKQLLYTSYEKHKREYLFESNTHLITEKTLLRYLRNITNVQGLTIDIMRSSYITHFYEHNRSYKSRDTLAKQMRHSQLTATKNYNKVLDPNISLTTLKQENQMLRNKIIDLEK